MSRFVCVRYQPVDQRCARRQLRKRLLELCRKLCDGVVHAFVHERVVGIASHHADPTRVADIHLYALALDFASTLRHRQHLGRVGADQTCADLHLGIDVVLSLHRTAAKTAKAGSPPAGGLVSVIIMRDGAQDNGVDSEHFAQLGGGDRISAVAVAEVLLRQELIDGIALDYAYVAVLHQFSDQEVRGSFSEIGSAHLDKGKLHATLDGGIVEVKDGYALFRTLPPS